MGGPDPVLVEVLGCGRCVLYLDTVENREVAGGAAIAFEKSEESLAEKITLALNDLPLRQQCQTQAQLRVNQCYRWEQVTDQYERLFRQLIGQGQAEQIQSQPADPREEVKSEPLGRAKHGA